MGLLLIEYKKWISKYEQITLSTIKAEVKSKREKNAHSIAIPEAEKQEESLKKALGVEKQSVANVRSHFTIFGT